MSGAPRATNQQPPSGNMLADSALGLVPQTLVPYLQLNQRIWDSGPLSPAEIEVARLRNARTVNCVYCKSVRYDIARADGLSEERVAMIADDYQSSALSDREKLIVAFTDCFLHQPKGLTDALRTALSAAFTAQELAHLALVVAHFSGFSRCAVALGGMPDTLPVMEVSVPQ